MSYRDLIDRLCLVTEKQLVAARCMDVKALNLASTDRADLLFELEVELQEGVPPQERDTLRPKLVRLMRLEERVEVVVSMVNQTLESAMSQDSLVYGPPKGR